MSLQERVKSLTSQLLDILHDYNKIMSSKVRRIQDNECSDLRSILIKIDVPGGGIKVIVKTIYDGEYEFEGREIFDS